MNTGSDHPLVALTDADLQALLRRAIWITIVIGGIAATAVWFASGWRNGAMLASGAAISAASIIEWKRIIRLVNNALDGKKLAGGTVLVIFLFMLRLAIFAAVIYGSLKCFQGSVVALLSGLSLAVLAMLWEALRLLRS